MPNQRREALRGAEVHTLDVIFEVLTAEQWAELLKAPLQRAVAKGDRDLARRLVKAGAEIEGALHDAIRGGCGHIANDLLESGASISAKDTKGGTPLHVAALHGNSEMVQLLLRKGADKDAVDNLEVKPLYMATFRGHLAATVALLAAGADVSVRCGQFKTPVMHVAAEKGHAEILRAMIKYGADVDAVDPGQHTALHTAASWNKADAIDVLVEAGASIEARDEHGRTPLHLASLELSRETLLCLLKHGAAVNAQSNSLRTPLMRAAYVAGTQGAAGVVDSLLRAGADETIVDVDGRRAVDATGGEAEDAFPEDVERVRELLVNAPVDRAWRRRGYLILCRAHPDRVPQNQMLTSGTYRINIGRGARSRAKLARTGAGAGDSTVDDSTGDDWAFVLARVLQLQEEGIFRTIVGYL